MIFDWLLLVVGVAGAIYVATNARDDVERPPLRHARAASCGQNPSCRFLTVRAGRR
jgi:hypothetical protein